MAVTGRLAFSPSTGKQGHPVLAPRPRGTIRPAASSAAGLPGDASFSESGAGVVSFHTFNTNNVVPVKPLQSKQTSGTSQVNARGCSGSTSFRTSGYASFRSGGEVAKDSANRTFQQLQSLGIAGVVAYGLLNTLYYTCTFLFVWTCVAKVPSGEGAAAAARSFLTVFATVWAGSQVTKVARAGGAVVLAPFVDKALDWIAAKRKYESKQQAFLLVLGICLALAAALFAGVVIAWA